MEDEVTTEEVVVEVPVFEVLPEDCTHNSGVNFCSGLRENGEQCSHCASCGTQL
jgi:hypothetical protein